jgi:purine-nucleoside phosphorylase
MQTWFIAAATVLFLFGALFFLFQRKRPDQLILLEKKGKVVEWTRSFYPKRICLSLSNTVHSFTAEVRTMGRGKIEVLIKVSVSFHTNPAKLENLIRVGGWSTAALKNVEKEITNAVPGIVGSVVENLEITEMQREAIARNLLEKLERLAENSGVQISTVTVISADPVDAKITEAIKKLEEARLQEIAERTLQTSRTLQAELKAQADQRIAQAEHEVAMKKLALQKIREAEAAELALATVKQQNERRKLELEIEKKEVEIFTQNPALLLLAPQLTRLTEASQQLKNAETVVSFSSEFFNKLPQPLQEIFKLLNQPHSSD